MRSFQLGSDFLESDQMQQPMPPVNMSGQPFMGQPFMQTSPGNMTMQTGGMGGGVQGMTNVSGLPGQMGQNLGQMQLPAPNQLNLGNFNQLPQQLPREPERNMTMPNLGMMPMYDQNRMDNTGPRMPSNPMGQGMDGQNQMGQMAILAGGLPQNSGQVMGAFCAQMLGASMPAQMEQLRPEKESAPMDSSMLRQPFMLQELANAAMMRDLDSNSSNLQNHPNRALFPDQQPNAPNMGNACPQSNQNPLLTLQQQQLILQQLQQAQPSQGGQGQPSQTLGFCGMPSDQLPNAGTPQLGQLNQQAPQNFPNQLRMQGMQNLLSDFQAGCSGVGGSMWLKHI